MNELNIKLQGKDQFVHDMYRNARVFKAKLKQTSQIICSFFHTGDTERGSSTCEEMQQITGRPAWREKFSSLKLDEFYASLSEAKFANIQKTAQRMLVLSGSTYVCEQIFSMNTNKAPHRSQLTDKHLRSVLRITTTKLTPNFGALGTTSHKSCMLKGQIVNCTKKSYYWVPALPPDITHLFLEGNYIREVNCTSFSNYEELQVLDLGMQTATLVIRNNTFLRQKNLIKLVLGHNRDLQLEPWAFTGLFNLRYLFLDYCHLTDSILAKGFLEPLFSLEILDLSYNFIVQPQPGLFFSKLTNLTWLNLKLNKIERLCEEDLIGFRGKYFQYLNLESNRLFKWESCGNPFKGIAFNILDLSTNGLNMNQTTQFFKAIEGTQINHLVYGGVFGKGFSHANIPDPDESTFEGLKNSTVTYLDLSKNHVFALHRAVFSPLKDVATIDVSQNKINRINYNAFSGLQGSLKVLNLSTNLLGEIHSYTFSSLTQLQVLDLSYNHIGVLGYGAFSGLKKLQVLNLTSNALRDLYFPGSLPKLEILFLGKNKLKEIYQLTVLGMNSISVDVSKNKLTDMKDVYTILTNLKYLRKLSYGGNSILWCSVDRDITIPHNSLEVLDLHDSSLQIIWAQGMCLHLFDHLKNLLWLDLSYNSLETLPHGIFGGLSSLEGLDLSSNALIYLEMDVFPATLKILDLSKNFLSSPDPKTFQSLTFLSLEANQFYCDCHLESFINWVNTTNVTFLFKVKEYRCEFPAAVHGLLLLEYQAIIEPCEKDDKNAVQDIKFALFCSSAILIISVLLTGIIHAHFRRHIFTIYKKIADRVVQGPKASYPQDKLKYDVFLCFHNNDYRWVEAALLKKLDNQFSEENIFRCCFEGRDFLPGEDHLLNISDAIWSSRKTLCIVSRQFIKDGWCLEAFSLAQSRMLEELTSILILLVVGKVTHYQLMKCNTVRAFVQRREYLIWPEDPQDTEWFYERLISRLLKDTKVKKNVEDKPEATKPELQPDAEGGIQPQTMKETAM
ncbi:toll-like receptor 5 [Pholidichthys leucotaenia]